MQKTPSLASVAEILRIDPVSRQALRSKLGTIGRAKQKTAALLAGEEKDINDHVLQVRINGKGCFGILDSGANCNVIAEERVINALGMSIKRTNTVLRMANGSLEVPRAFSKRSTFVSARHPFEWTFDQ